MASRQKARARFLSTQLAAARVDMIGMRERALGYHVTMRLESSQVLAPTVVARRLAAVVFHEEGAARELLAFRLADTHAHALVLSTREVAGAFARYVQQRLRWKLCLPSRLERARFTPITTQRHLERAFGYLIRQEQHHAIELDPRHEASSAPDLVGMRLLGRDVARRMRAALPRVRREEVLAAMGLERCEPELDRLADAAAAASALADLGGRSPRANAARTAAVHAASELSTGDIAKRLGLTRRCIERTRARPAESALVAAIRLQLTVRPQRRSDPIDW